MCFPSIGCFTDELSCHQGCAPETPEQINTRFFLYTPELPDTLQALSLSDVSSIRNSNFRGNRPTKFIIHGLNGNAMQSKFLEMKDALLSIGNFNVILVDWGDGADLINLQRIIADVTSIPHSYAIARQNTRVVGRQIGELSKKLVSLAGSSYSSMHLIGHSLGAHTAGYAGEYLSGVYGRITGLDPAGPGYEGFSQTGCLLEKSDARFVDVIHTDTVFGYNTEVGHQDFFPSGGQHQVSCLPFDHICYHLRVVDFFTESITSSCSFRAYPCNSWLRFLQRKCRKCGDSGCSRMGYFADLSPARGSFMLGTSVNEPYCRQDSGVPPSFWGRFLG
ncbi:putative pancreatic lipase-related protein 2 isoform X2 [Apostichopus japonicus]|uniref:Putative pancreatic lipase-related protein 2 isoform X2 n=1 Tax=Stichopus japonicus TaxID=307972 RepID=A0A2G8L496_STIJA|nr:putative pancreatic lipase-related protein 2 isoform X2 [Apostichopus japonicus]